MACGQIQPATCFRKYCLTRTLAMLICSGIGCGAEYLFVTETIWYAKPKIFIMWPFTEKKLTNA